VQKEKIEKTTSKHLINEPVTSKLKRAGVPEPGLNSAREGSQAFVRAQKATGKHMSCFRSRLPLTLSLLQKYGCAVGDIANVLRKNQILEFFGAKKMGNAGDIFTNI